MKIKDSVEQIYTLDLFQNCDVPQEASVIFDPEVDLLKQDWLSPVYSGRLEI